MDNNEAFYKVLEDYDFHCNSDSDVIRNLIIIDNILNFIRLECNGTIPDFDYLSFLFSLRSHLRNEVYDYIIKRKSSVKVNLNIPFNNYFYNF